MGTVQLSDKEATFVRLVAKDGLEPTRAATIAGYASAYGYGLLRKPSVVAAIHEALQTELTSVIAPHAVRVAFELLREKTVSPRVRADIAFKFMGLAGHIAPTSKEKPQEKQIGEMSREELFAYIARNEAEIQKIEGELADRATDVSEGVAKQPGAVIEAKPLSFLE